VIEPKRPHSSQVFRASETELQIGPLLNGCSQRQNANSIV